MKILINKHPIFAKIKSACKIRMMQNDLHKLHKSVVKLQSSSLPDDPTPGDCIKQANIPYGQNVEVLIKKLKKDLPVLPAVVIRLLNLVLDEKSSVEDISKIVRVDQALTAKVLKIVNSAAYGLRGKVSTVDHAFTILGFDAIKNLCLSISIFDNLVKKEQVGCFNKSHFWRHSLAVASVSKALALLVNYKSRDEAYVAGLLHDAGKLILMQIIPEEYSNYLKKLNSNPKICIGFEEKTLLINHALAGNLIFKKWNFPLSLQRAVELHHGTKMADEKIPDLAAIVSVADFICWTQGLGSFNLFIQPTLDSQMEKIINLKKVSIEPVLKTMEKELELNGKIFNFKLTEPEELKKSLQKANFELGRINTLCENIKKKQDRQIRALSALNNIAFKIRKELKPSQIIQNVLPEIREGFGFARLVWLFVDHEKKMMILSGIYGEFKNNVPMASLGWSWDNKIGFPLCTCIQNKKIIHLKQDDCADESNPNSYLLRALQSSELILVPISTDNIITELLLLDNPEGNTFISADTLHLLDILAMNLGMAIENTKLFQRNAQMAIIDPLTNIYNRRQLDSSLDNEISRSVRFKQSFSIAIFDIDHFKTINDNFGHSAGDVVLKDVSEIIKKSCRKIDIVGRIGGDEFLAILPNTQMQQAFIFAERIRVNVEKYELHAQNLCSKYQMTISIGIAEFDSARDNAENLLHKADKALYKAKQKGRNLVGVL